MKLQNILMIYHSQTRRHMIQCFQSTVNLYITTLFIKQNFCCNEIKVRKEAKVRKRYNKVPHLIKDTTWESNKLQSISPTSAKRSALSKQVDHKAAMNRRISMRNTRHKKTQMIDKRSTALEQSVKIFYWRA